MPPFTREQEERIRELLREELSDFLFSGKYVFQKDIEIFDGRNIQLALGVGTKIGTAATQKIGLWGVTPVVQPSANADTSGITLANLEIEVNQVKQTLRDVGIIAT